MTTSFNALHCISHPGACATEKLIATWFVWPNMTKYICVWARSCLHCQQSKVSRHNCSPIGTFCMPDARFSHLHLDLVGLLPILRDCTYLLTCIDHFSHWPEAILITDVKAEMVIHAFIDQWVTRFGTPAITTMDHGPQFKSSLFSSILNFLGCSRVQNFPSACSWLLSGRASECKINAKPKSRPWLLGKLQTPGAHYILFIVVRSSYNGINAV